jgi:hypothetical protein
MYVLSLLVGCAPDLTPAWAWDPIWLEGTASGAHGFQTWQLYGPKWPSRQSDRHYVCSVVTELEGRPSECDAPGCEIAFDLTPTLLESDCADPALAEQPLFLALERLALGGPYVGEDAPWPDRTTTSYADYGSGWELHGFAYPEAYDLGGAGDPTWTGEDPFLFTPDAAFPL